MSIYCVVSFDGPLVAYLSGDVAVSNDLYRDA